MRKLIQLFILMLCAQITTAQLQESDTAHWQINGSVTGRLNTGNFERLIIIPEANISHISSSGKYGFSVNQRYSYGTFGPFKTENDLLSRNFLYLNPHKKSYPYIMIWANTHEQQKLLYRYQLGIGYSCKVLQKKLSALKLSATISYENNNYREGSLTNIDNPSTITYTTTRATLRFSGNHFSKEKIFNIYYEGYFQQAINNADNWRFFGEGGLLLKAIHGFSMKSFISYEYQTVHIAKLKPNDLILNFGINYHWSEKKK